MKLKKLRKISRRNALQLIAAFTGTAMIPSMSFSQPNKALDRINEITKGLGATESDIYLDLPEIAENGNQVKIVFEIDSPMNEEEFVKTVFVFADGNPEPDVAKFNFTPAMGACGATTRMRLSKTQNVIVLAEMNNGLFAKADTKVKVTIGGCGG